MHRLILATGAALLLPLVLAGCIADEPAVIDAPDSAMAASATAPPTPCPLEGTLVYTKMDSLWQTELTFKGAIGCELRIWTATYESFYGHSLEITDSRGDTVYENGFSAGITYGGNANQKERTITSSEGTYTVTLKPNFKATVSIRVTVV